MVPDPPSATPRVGDYAAGEVLLEKYELKQRLASGGMGDVWRAHNRLLDCEVAVKLMFRSASDTNQVALQRAHTEARLAAQLQHPAICTTLDFGVTDRGDPLVVTELLRGISLDQRMRRSGPLNPVLAVQIMLPVLDGLAAAHAKGIVHRDVKPANIFLAELVDGAEQPKLLDFGIARGLKDKQRLTVAGAVCGTPDYMSPEQARGSKDVDLRSDLWSVCVTLYEMLTLDLPFDADNYNAVMFQISNRPHRPIKLDEADRDLTAIIERGLQKDPEKRYQSARELSLVLSAFLVRRGVETDSAGHALRSRWSAPELSLSEADVNAQLQELNRRRRASTIQRVAASQPARRWVMMLAIASVLGLGAWSSRDHAEGPVVTTDAPVVPARAPLTLEPIEIEVSVPVTPSKVQVGGAKTKPTQVSPPARTARGDARRPDNALGYDFGL
jgi:serine/threonine protein kinase